MESPIHTRVKLMKTEAELIRYRNESEMWRHEVQRLNSELLELQRVIPILKQLVKSLDAAIRRRIERLNSHRAKAQKPFLFDMGLEREELMWSLRNYDFNTYYRKTPQHDRLLYRIVRGFYGAFYKFTFVALLVIYKLIRRVKG